MSGLDAGVTNEQACERIEELVCRVGGVSMVEIERLLESVGIDVRGESAWGIFENNILMWANMSERFAAIMEQLRDRNRVVPTPTQVLVYAVDGKLLDLPLAKRMHKYKKERWMPVEFNERKAASTPRRGGGVMR